MQPTTNLGLLKGIYQDVRWDQSYDELFNALDEALAGWVRYGWIYRPATAAANNQFQIPGDVTSLFPAGRKVRCVLSGTQPVVTVSVANYAANVTTVTVDETTIDGTLVSVWVNVFDCLYSSAVTFTVAGDKTAVFVAGLGVKVQLAGGTVYGTVASSSYGAPNTTVILSGAALTAPIYCLRVSPVRPRAAADANLPGDCLDAQPGQIYGIKLANSAGDLVNDIDLSAGFAFSNDAALASVARLTLGSTLTKRLDASWAVGTNQGGLDTGSIANATYFVWLIQRPDTGVVDALFSLSASAPTMPANYTKKALLGAIIRAGGTILAFTQTGDYFGLTTPVLDISVTNPGTASVTRTLASVPLGIIVEASLTVASEGTASSASYAYVRPLTATDQAPASGAAPLYNVGSLTPNVHGSTSLTIATNASAQIATRNAASDAGSAIRICTFGWWHRLGRRGC